MNKSLRAIKNMMTHTIHVVYSRDSSVKRFT